MRKMTQKVTISVKEGKLRGFKTTSQYSGVEYYSFLGVPYGQSTGGQARFKDPVKIKPWNHIFDATAEKEGCLQFSFRKKDMAGDEDCLYNNIHTPKIPSKDDHLKAVIVNIHPGGFFHGSPDPNYYGSPEYVMNRDIVYVCVGYRLHILGHLNLGLKECRGNQCLKDIILSLKWIQDNIHVFGGDRENVTLLGSSSGSALVHCLLLSPLAKDLYHKAILMGMYVFNPTLTTAVQHMDLAFELATSMGYSGNPEDKRKLLNFYKKTNMARLILYELQKMQTDMGLQVFPNSPFAPLIEYSDNSPLPSSFDELIPSTNRVPIVIGFCDKEAIMGILLLQKHKQLLSKVFHKSLNQNAWGWGVDLNEKELKLIQKNVEDFYVEGESIDIASQSIKCDILTDVALSGVYHTLIDVVSSDPSSPVYVYKFSYEGKLCTMKTKIDKQLEKSEAGSFHAGDYPYWSYAQNRQYKEMNIMQKDHQMIETFTNLLTTFAKTGNPNYENLHVNWKPSTPKNPCYLSINETLEVKDELLNGKRMEFWHDLKKCFKKD